MREKQTKKGARRNLDGWKVTTESLRQHERWVCVYCETPSLPNKGGEDDIVQTKQNDGNSLCLS